jgi:hypothetical protein
VPVSLISSRDAAAVATGNATTGLIESRWLEVFPVWEDEHRVMVGREDTCADKADKADDEHADADDADSTCSRPVASPPIIMDNATTPFLMKGDPGVFLSSITDNTPEQVRIKAAPHRCRTTYLTLSTRLTPASMACMCLLNGTNPFLLLTPSRNSATR